MINDQPSTDEELISEVKKFGKDPTKWLEFRNNLDNVAKSNQKLAFHLSVIFDSFYNLMFQINEPGRKVTISLLEDFLTVAKDSSEIIIDIENKYEIKMKTDLDKLRQELKNAKTEGIQIKEFSPSKSALLEFLCRKSEVFIIKNQLTEKRIAILKEYLPLNLKIKLEKEKKLFE